MATGQKILFFIYLFFFYLFIFFIFFFFLFFFLLFFLHYMGMEAILGMLPGFYTHIGSAFLLMLPMKFGFDWPNAFKGNDV